ncbi:MAG TPA: hypothetical protein VEX64_02870, partial [Pyrinomonadaceae bacterium]|nr:hypothetical protein [Pyrinomonadaceae bacterium]
NLDDTDSETADIYYFLGLANHLLEKLDLAREFYTKAENAYRAAFVKIDHDEIRQFYPKRIVQILEAHSIAAKDAELKDEVAEIDKRLAETKTEFAKYLEK